MTSALYIVGSSVSVADACYTLPFVVAHQLLYLAICFILDLVVNVGVVVLGVVY